jgi:glycerol-3-phosphate dehydrogenase
LTQLDDTFDVIIIGGGINGAGILFDAAQRGLRALLVERDDIASGTSSRSSKLIHGGLRYLRQMQFSVTRLACRERDRMVSLDPHLVQPIDFLYAALEDDKVGGRTVDLGLWMYDRLTRRASKHAHVEPEAIATLAPGLDLSKLDRAMTYKDAVVDDAALTLAVAATGFAYGGLVLTRSEVIEAIRNPDGAVHGVLVKDHESGEAHELRAHVVVNATGVWVDGVRERLGVEGHRLRPSRGAHIVLPSAKLPLQVAVVVSSPADGRPVFLIPHPEGVLVGTTDLFHTGSLDDPRATRDEVSYLLGTVRARFPTAGVSESDLVGAFAGLRPILDSDVEKPSEASREDDIWHDQGMVSVAGGKLTTWRATAESAVDEILEHLPEERASAAGPCLTAGTPLSGVAPPDLSKRLVEGHGLEPAIAAAMARRLGSRAWWAPKLARRARELRPLVDGSDLSLAEVRVHLAVGATLRLDDLLLRRARIGVWDPAMARELAPLLRSTFRKELGWDRRRWARELDAFYGALEGWSPAGIR